MNIENHTDNAKKGLDLARDKINAGEFHTAIQCLSSAYSDVRELLQHAYELDREAKQAASPAGEDTR